MPLRVGLTGGIASGKSTVAALFAALGVPIIDTDLIAREVVAPGTPLLAKLIERFGPRMLNEDGSLDRRALRAEVFADDAARRDLEALLHPAIRDRVEARSHDLALRGPGAYQIIAIPLLVESGGRIPVDRVLVVDCPEALQIRRVMARDHSSEGAARAVLEAQVSRAERLAAADDVLENAGELPVLRDRVLALHRQYQHAAATGVYAHAAGRAE